MSRTFKLFQLASIRTSQQHICTSFIVRQVEKDFLPKHRYGKTAALVQTMCVPITLSMIRQVVQKKFNRPDVRLHGLDAQALYIEIACISSTVRTSYFMVQTLKALIWKLRAAKVQPSGLQGNTIRMRLYSGKNFKQIQKADRTVVHPDAVNYRPDVA
jgi:hypothetical protein